MKTSFSKNAEAIMLNKYYRNIQEYFRKDVFKSEKDDGNSDGYSRKNHFECDNVNLEYNFLLFLHATIIFQLSDIFPATPLNGIVKFC